MADELNKAKHISSKYGFKKLVNFYQLEEYGFGTLEESEAIADQLILDLSGHILDKIKQQGYVFEREVNLDGKVGRQWKKSIQEILDSYDLQRIRLNSELKEKFRITDNGYPNIITLCER